MCPCYIQEHHLGICQTNFHHVCTSLQSHQQWRSIALFPYPHQHFLSPEIFILAFLTGVRWILRFVLIFIFLTPSMLNISFFKISFIILLDILAIYISNVILFTCFPPKILQPCLLPLLLCRCLWTHPPTPTFPPWHSPTSWHQALSGPRNFPPIDVY